MLSPLLGFKEGPKLVIRPERGCPLSRTFCALPPDHKVEDSIPILLWRKLKLRVPKVTKLINLLVHIF